MTLFQIGQTVRVERLRAGLSQNQLSKLTGLSRVTINQLENGTLDDLGYRKLENILRVLGIDMETAATKAGEGALSLAAKTASTSYKDSLTPDELRHMLQTGEASPKFAAHLMTLLDEAPTSIVVSAVREAATDTIPAKQIMKHLSTWASEWQTNRKAWR